MPGDVHAGVRQSLLSGRKRQTCIQIHYGSWQRHRWEGLEVTAVQGMLAIDICGAGTVGSRSGNPELSHEPRRQLAFSPLPRKAPGRSVTCLKAEFLSLGTVDLISLVILCCGAVLCATGCLAAPLAPLPAGCQDRPYILRYHNQNVSRHC